MLAYEQQIEYADGVVAFESLELVDDPALEVCVRGKADRHKLYRSYLLRHHSPPSLDSRSRSRITDGFSTIAMLHRSFERGCHSSGTLLKLTVLSRLIPLSKVQRLFP